MHLENEIIFILKSERRIAHDTNYGPTEVQDVSCPLQEKQTQSRTQCKLSRRQSVGEKRTPTRLSRPCLNCCFVDTKREHAYPHKWRINTIPKHRCSTKTPSIRIIFLHNGRLFSQELAPVSRKAR